MADRAEFKFVLDGIELSQDQHEHIALAIQRAALEAISGMRGKLVSPVVLGHGSLKLNPEWRGIYVINGPLADELGPRIEEIGFLRR